MGLCEELTGGQNSLRICFDKPCLAWQPVFSWCQKANGQDLWPTTCPLREGVSDGSGFGCFDVYQLCLKRLLKPMLLYPTLTISDSGVRSKNLYLTSFQVVSKHLVQGPHLEDNKGPHLKGHIFRTTRNHALRTTSKHTLRTAWGHTLGNYQGPHLRDYQPLNHQGPCSEDHHPKRCLGEGLGNQKCLVIQFLSSSTANPKQACCSQELHSRARTRAYTGDSMVGAVWKTAAPQIGSGKAEECSVPKVLQCMAPGQEPGLGQKPPWCCPKPSPVRSVPTSCISQGLSACRQTTVEPSASHPT